jgi:hypothetical protein
MHYIVFILVGVVQLQEVLLLFFFLLMKKNK